MTIILAGIFQNGVILAADSRRSTAHGALPQRVQKVRKLSDRVAVAKGGYGDLADAIWEQLAALPDDVRSDPLATADHAERLPRSIYDECRAEATRQEVPDLGLYLFVGGLDKAGHSVVVGIDVGGSQRKEYRASRAGDEVTSMGSVPNALAIAGAAASKAKPPAPSPLPADEWVREAVRMAIAEDPVTVGFPADLIAISPGVCHQIELVG